MGKRRRGRKTTGKDPKKTLPKIPALQKGLEPGTQDFLQASRTLTRARDDALLDDVNDDDGSSSSSTSSEIGGSGGEEGRRSTDACDPHDPAFYGHHHRDPSALAQHLAHLGHDWGPRLIRECGVASVEAALRDLEDATEPIRTEPGFVTAQARMHAMDSPSNTPRADREEFARQRQEAKAREGSTERNVPTATGDPDPGAERIWQAAIERVRPQMPRPTFETWIAPTRGHSFDGDALVVLVNDEYCAGVLYRQRYGALAEAVRLERGQETEITFAVHVSGAGPAPTEVSVHDTIEATGWFSVEDMDISPGPFVPQEATFAGHRQLMAEVEGPGHR